MNGKDKKIGGDLRKIRTFSSDIKEKIKNEKISLSDMAIAETKQIYNNNIFSIEKKEKKERGTFFYVSVIVIPVVLISLLFVLIINKKMSVPPYANNLQEIISTVNGFEEIPITKQTNRYDFISSFRQKTNDLSNEKNRGLMAIIPVNTEGTKNERVRINDFFETLEIKPPSIIKRNLTPNFFFGFSLPEQEAVLILRLEKEDYGAGFAGMIDWEKNLDNDFRELISKDERAQTNNNDFNDFKEIVSKNFESKNIKNYDVRYIAGKDGKTRILYSVLNDKTIVISGGESSFESVLPYIIK